MKVKKRGVSIGYIVFDWYIEDNKKRYYLKMSTLYKDLKIIKDAHPMIEISKNLYENIKKNSLYKYINFDLYTGN